MTDEYKSNVLRQITGNEIQEFGNNRPIFITTDSTSNKIVQYIDNSGYVPANCIVAGYLTRNSQILLFYNEFTSDKSSWLASFIVVTDADLNPIGMIEQYSSGTLFSRFEKILDNDIGEGRIFFIDRFSNQYRLVYMNDPTSKQIGDSYQAEILISYFVQNMTLSDALYVFKKAENEAKFILVSTIFMSGKINLLEIQINVGSSNEWNLYSYTNTTYGFQTPDAYPIWSENFECRICIPYYINGTSGCSCLVLKNGESTLEVEKNFQISNSSTTYRFKMTNYNTIYGGLGLLDVYKIDLISQTTTIIMSYGLAVEVGIQVVNDNVFMLINHKNSNNENETLLCMAIGNDFYEIPLLTYFDALNDDPLFFINNNYNLYTFRITNGIKVDNAYLIYNVNNYNGASFNDNQSVISNSVILNNSDGLPIFARNLYNKTITSNTVESTVEIPAYQLNGITIAEQRLLSKNNNNIIYQYEDLEKNIYETVLLNFFNTLNVIDNNENKNKLMMDASNCLVNALENQESDNMKALKYRITYQDDSTMVGNIGETTIDTNTNTATLTFAIYTRAGIKKLEIISYNENCTYATINETFDMDSYYKVVQEVAII
jgi:hypothetical protein